MSAEHEAANEDCYYGDDSVCTGETWVCIGCGEEYCEAHGHQTVKGINVECIICERSREERENGAWSDDLE